MEQPLLLGYSQGARIALQVALQRPELIHSLVLVSGSPGLSGQARNLRRVADDGLASRIERIGVVRFIDEWLAQPMTSTDAVSDGRRTADRAIRLENSATDLAAALRGMGQASVSDSSKQLGSLRLPVAFVAGRNDPRYTALASEMAKACNVRPILVNNVGHNVVLEAARDVADVVHGLLSR